MILRAKRYTRGVFLSVLRQYFASHQKFPWQQNIVKTKIMIEESFPKVPYSHPCIIIERPTVQPFERALSRGLVEEKYDDALIDGITRSVYAGEININRVQAITPISVYSIDPFMGEMVADEVFTLLGYSCIEKFSKSGLEIVDVRDSGPSEEVFGNDLYYKNNITIHTHQEWEINIEEDEADVIEKITIPDIDGVIAIGIDGVTNGNF